MININVSSNIDETIRRWQAKQKQVTYAIAVALTKTAQSAAADVQQAMPTEIDRPIPFTVKSIGWQMATKATLQSAVFIRPLAASYLAPLIVGGVAKPKKRALLDPTNVPLNQYGNLPRGKVKSLLARKDVFSGTVHGVPGIWQRLKKGGVKLLVRYEPSQQKRAQFHFPDLVRKSVEKNFARHLDEALRKAMATAR